MLSNSKSAKDRLTTVQGEKSISTTRDTKPFDEPRGPDTMGVQNQPGATPSYSFGQDQGQGKTSDDKRGDRKEPSDKSSSRHNAPGNDEATQDRPQHHKSHHSKHQQSNPEMSSRDRPGDMQGMSEDAMLDAKDAPPTHHRRERDDTTKDKSKDFQESMPRDTHEGKSKSRDTYESGRDKSSDAGDNVKDKARDIKDKAKDTYEGAKDKAKDTWEGAKVKASDAADNVKEKGRDMKEKAKDTYEGAKDKAKDTWEGAKDKANDAADTVKDKARDVKEKAKDTYEGAKDKVSDAADNIKEKARNVKDKAKDTYEGAKDKVNDAADNIKEKARDVKDKAKDTYEGAKDKVQDIADKAKDKVADVKDKAVDLKDRAKDKVADVKDKAADLKDRAMDKAADIKDKAVDLKDKAMDKVADVKDKVADLKDRAMDKAADVKDKVQDVYAQAKDKASDMYAAAADKAADFKDKAVDIKDNIKEKLAPVIDTASDKAAAIKEKLAPVIDNAKEKAQDVYDAAKDKASMAFNKAKDIKDAAGDRLASVADSAKDKLHVVTDSKLAHTITDKLREDDMKRCAVVVLSTIAVTQGVAHICQPSDATALSMIGAGALAIQWVVFLLASGILLGNKPTERFFDLAGSMTFAVLVIQSLAASSFFSLRQLLLTSAVLLWCTRLGMHLFKRSNVRGGMDHRFKDIRGSPARFLEAWTLQGLWVFLTALPVYAVNASAYHPGLGFRDIIGLALFGIGLSMEAMADKQKMEFKMDRENRNRFITHGLWATSRHPNYFGEILLWTGLYISATCALPLMATLTCAISPIFVAALLIYFTGIPMLEDRRERKHANDPDYQRYKEETPVLVPVIGRAGDASF